LGDERCPGLVVEVGADACAVAGDFTWAVLMSGCMIGVVW
jgi:hypothetical protein